MKKRSRKRAHSSLSSAKAAPSRQTKSVPVKAAGGRRLRFYSYVFLAVVLTLGLAIGGYACWYPGRHVPSEMGESPSGVPQNHENSAPGSPSNGLAHEPASQPPSPSDLPPANPDASLTPNGDSGSGLDQPTPASTRLVWYYVPGKNHQQPFIPQKARELMARYHGIYMGNPNEKRIYLTFDAGYEMGYTASILDTLAQHQIKAAFFVTKPFITSHPELVKRMLADGHIVGSHTATHPDLTTLSEEKIKNELETTGAAFLAATGQPLARLIRPPNGAYSEKVLATVYSLDYRPVFWSMAFRDWDVNNQPAPDEVVQNVLTNAHPGAVILLHNVSSANAQALPNIIAELKKQGYVFAPLSEIR